MFTYSKNTYCSILILHTIIHLVICCCTILYFLQGSHLFVIFFKTGVQYRNRKSIFSYFIVLCSSKLLMIHCTANSTKSFSFFYPILCTVKYFFNILLFICKLIIAVIMSIRTIFAE